MSNRHMPYLLPYARLMCYGGVSAMLLLTACKDRRPSANAVVSKLVACHVLAESRQQYMEDMIGEADTSSAAIINALIDVQYKDLGLSRSGEFISISWEVDSLSREDLAIAMDSVGRYLDALHDCQVVNDQQHQNFKREIPARRVVHPLQLLDLLLQDANYQQYITPARLLSFADTLRHAGVVLPDRYQALKDRIVAGRIGMHYDLLDYTYGMYIDLAAYPGDPAHYLPEIYGRIARLLPELAFTDFQFQIVKNEKRSTPDYQDTDVIVSFKAKGVPYSYQSFIHMPSGENDGYIGYLDENNFYQIFNHVLIDQGSPYRLHMVPALTEYTRSHRYFGILALTQAQQHVLDAPNSLFGFVQHETFDGALSATAIRQAIDDFQQTGVLAHLTRAQVDSALTQRPTDLEELLLALPDVVYVFDTELNNLDRPYDEFLHELSRISHHAFHPENIRDDFDPNKTRGEVAFSIGRQKYTCPITINDDWVDPDFLEYVFCLPAKLKHGGRFYSLPADGQSVHFIYLTPPQAQLLQEKYKLSLTLEDTQGLS